MSVRASNWAWGLQSVSGTTKLVLMALADCANHEGVCWPSNDTISEKAVASAATVRRCVARLEALGLIMRVERKRADGSQTSNVYYLQIGSAGGAGVAVVEPESEADCEPEQGEADVTANENNVDISRPAQNECPPTQNERPPSQNCAGWVSPVSALEPPINQNNPKSHDRPDLSALMAMEPHERARAMKRWGLTPASFGKTTREMGLNPRALKQNPRAKAKAGTPVPPERQRVFVVQYSPQWEAWVKHRGRSIPTGNYRDPETGRFLTGWWFDTLWPPDCAESS
ncbi:helix-turn-helix domain-containing protein [Cohaesibacter marisflavi]|uniref:helix-turn-helix domain-containing protein n=1 Tax=Cohaesibacter marisflavi TaxID=655353 RepID=UPI0029C94B73|nr:helix-turn-helix domain-containing protein [Cohaesibacter marisflavi]